MSVLETARAYRKIIETAVGSLSDSDALKAVTLFPKWKPGMELESGARVYYGEKLYRVKDGMGHTTQADWTPDVTVSLFDEVCETATGTVDDPIPYDGNMVLEAGKYYTQGDVKYLCTRDTVNAVYHALADLVGLYVEVAENV
ncbi:MAG: hypothetical protein IJY93_01180 [Clostridia bacterium]|nr:hypothetical protein [Clostridia bacterium]